MEITSACEPGSIGAVVVFVVAIVLIKTCDNSPNCGVTVNGQQVSMAQSQGPIRPYQPELQREPYPNPPQRAPFPREFIEDYIPFNATGLVFPFNTTGPVFPFSTTTRSPPVKVQPATQEVAERWQLICGDNSARLPAQRLAKEEQRIATCLARCSQKLKEASGKCKQ